MVSILTFDADDISNYLFSGVFIISNSSYNFSFTDEISGNFTDVYETRNDTNNIIIKNMNREASGKYSCRTVSGSPHYRREIEVAAGENFLSYTECQ